VTQPREEQLFELEPDSRPAGRRARGPGRVQRALRALSAANRALLRATDEPALLQETCRVIVTEGGYSMACIGYAEGDEAGSVRPMAYAGGEAGVPAGDELTWADVPGGAGPLATVLRTGRPLVGAAIAGEAELAAWLETVHSRGHGAAAAFPFAIDGEVAGALGICAAEPDAFDAAEARVLGDLADDLGFGIAALRARLRQKDDKAQLARINRALRTLSAGNRTLLRAQSEQQLLQEMCTVIVEEGGYPIAWVGYAQQDEAKSVQVMANAGFGAELLGNQQMKLHFTWAESGIGVGPTGTAIRSGKPVIGRNLRNDPRLNKAREELIARGFPNFDAASVFPLHLEGRVLGNLSIYAQEAEAFDEAEARLLTEMADDLAYGIAALRTRERHREAEATIQRMAFHDLVTGLPNRVLLREKLDTALHGLHQQRRPLALLALKVEQFQEISDSLGYREGEQLLGEIAARLGRLVREDETLARGGEDEFVILMPGRGAAYACESAHRLIAATSEPVELSGLTANARVSIGIALAPGHGTDPDALIRRASVAAYQARGTAAGYALYAGGLDKDCTRRVALMGDLRRAIDHNELQLYCQPKVGIESGRVCGAEALVRWPHARLGLIPPGEFVKLAEHAGLIGSLTHWVLDAAFGQAYAWHEAGLDQPLAVNLSAQDLRDPLLLDRVRGLFATWGAQPEWIQFELTESALMEDPTGTLETLKKLRKLGVELFIDDYGTGYSSLSYLQKLPVDAIKIDQSFVGKMTDDHDSAIIVRSTIELGHNLALRIVAEGVENQHIWEQLASLGCDTAQGYFVSRPLPAEQFKDWEYSSPWHRADAPGTPA
jgi:diguanylate cyclase (GGDEF)-like protein